MNETWTIITMIASVAAGTTVIIKVYMNEKSKQDDRIKELENKVDHHQKFVSILEKKALKALEEEFEKKK